MNWKIYFCTFGEKGIDMRVVVVNKALFTVTTYTGVVSITISGANVIINDGTNHTYVYDSVKIMIA